MENMGTAKFVFGYKYSATEIEQLHSSVFPEDEIRRAQFFEDYEIGPTPVGEYFIGLTLAETLSSRTVEAEELKLKPNQLRELKYIMMNIRITEPPKFYIIVDLKEN